MAGFDNDVMYADNVDFSGGNPVSSKILSNGQLLIGSTVAPNIRVNTPSNGNNIQWSFGSGTITAAVVGPPSPTSLTNHGVVIGQGTSALVATATGSSGQVLQSGGAGADPSYSTATYPSTAGTSGNVMTSNGTNWVSTTPTTFTSVVVQRFTSSGTYTPTSGMKYCTIEVVGSGGGGGGVATQGASTSAGGGGGGSGGYARKTVTAATIGASQSVTIGAIGAGGTAGANNGSAGSACSVGAIVSASGGSGGTGASTVSGSPGGAAGVGSNGDINATGGAGTFGIGFFIAGVQSFGMGGNGGNSYFCGGALGVTNSGGASSVGNNGSTYGGGGSGASAGNSGTQKAGGDGSLGVVIITEYI